MEEKCVAFLQHLTETGNYPVAHSSADFGLLPPEQRCDILHDYSCQMDESFILFYELRPPLASIRSMKYLSENVEGTFFGSKRYDRVENPRQGIADRELMRLKLRPMLLPLHNL